MAKSLGLPVLADGVETEMQIALQAQECEVQGYFSANPSLLSR